MVFAYLRKSRDRREQSDPEVLARHRAILCDLLFRNNHEAQWYEEVRSGESIAARPIFQQLLARIATLPDLPRDRAGGHLYCIDTDRLARGDAGERAGIEDLLRRKGVLIVTPNGVTDLRDTDQRLLHNVKGALAEWELGKYRDRVARTRSDQVRQGQVRNGSVPFGYRWSHADRCPEPDPLEFPVLQALCRDALTLSFDQLSVKYGVPPTTIQTALKSPMICGWPARTTGYRPGTKRVIYLPREQWGWPEQEAAYEKAISREEWEALQRVFTARRKGRNGHGAVQDGWCRDVVRINGQEVRLGSYHGWGGKVPTYETRDRCLYVARAAVHSAATVALRDVLTRDWPRLSQALTAAQERPKAPSPSALEEERGRLMLEMRNHLLEMGREGSSEVRREVLREILEDLESRVKSLERQIQAFRSSAPILTSAEAASYRKVGEFLAHHFEREWPSAPEGLKRTAARAFLGEVAVTLTREGRAWQREVVVRDRGWL
jgi:DNA invertase Pin-like site-specific DNA recombinase